MSLREYIDLVAPSPFRNISANYCQNTAIGEAHAKIQHSQNFLRRFKRHFPHNAFLEANSILSSYCEIWLSRTAKGGGLPGFVKRAEPLDEDSEIQYDACYFTIN